MTAQVLTENLNQRTKQTQNLVFAEEYLLINKNNGADVEVKGRFQEAGPTVIEKVIFMLGEACYAASQDVYGKTEYLRGFSGYMTSPTEEPSSEMIFRDFMQQLTQTVEEFHKLGKYGNEEQANRKDNFMQRNKSPTEQG